MYYEFERPNGEEKAPTIPFRALLDKEFAKICPECSSGEMYGNEDVGFVCTWCNHKIEVKQEQEPII